VQSPEKKGLDRTVWKARVNAGVDISLVSFESLTCLL
jgi:hypothetical protein